jgi:CO/xanthine dehydrogenase Mo-binding subunit
MPIGGNATLLDPRALRDKVRCLAASMLEAREEDIVVDGGWVGVRGSPDRAMAPAVGNGGQLVTGTLMVYAVPRAAERVRRTLRFFRDRQTGDPA